jgi:hypothetical protein
MESEYRRNQEEFRRWLSGEMEKIRRKRKAIAKTKGESHE